MQQRIALASLAAALACAGSGHDYACDADAGELCGLHAGPDGGFPDLPPFVGKTQVVRRDGRYNGGADSLAFAGAVFTAVRSAGTRGVDGSASLKILRSADGSASWGEAATIALTGKDLREPKLASFRGQLYVTFTAWDGASDPALQKAVVRAAVSSDGASFQVIDALGMPSQALSSWRPRALGDALLLPVWTADESFLHPELDRATVLRGDGQTFAALGAPPIGGSVREPEVLVRSDGRLTLTVPQQQTADGPQRQTFCSAAQPASSAATIASWDCWSWPGPRIETPLLYEWNGALLLFGRHDLGDGRKRTGVWQVQESDRSLALLAELDSFGDTGSPGLVPTGANDVLVTYYSTSAADPRVQSLGHEPTEVEAIGAGFATDLLGVKLSLASAPIGK